MAEIKTLDNAGILFLKNNEGFRTKPYLDSKGIPTISIGLTYYSDGRRVTMNDPELSPEHAWMEFETILDHYEKAVWSVTRDDITQSQFNALVSIAFNIGIAGMKGSTFLRKVNDDPSDPSIRKAIMMWNKPKEIISRRTREADLYFS